MLPVVGETIDFSGFDVLAIAVTEVSSIEVGYEGEDFVETG